MEYLPQPFTPGPTFPDVLVDRIAAVHTASLRLAPDAAAAMAPSGWARPQDQAGSWTARHGQT
ncbi:hypothetical protein NKH18_00925 [Streptomyces sp. M10(2022)]